jgi:predicted GIY-YIG superfamily endonuclease
MDNKPPSSSKRNYLFADLLEHSEPEPQPDWSNLLLGQPKAILPRSSPPRRFTVEPPIAYPFTGAFVAAAVVYLILDAAYNVIYVGETTDLCRRIKQHRADASHLMHRHQPAWVKVEFGYENEPLRKTRASELILKHKPPVNLCL